MYVIKQAYHFNRAKLITGRVSQFLEEINQRCSSNHEKHENTTKKEKEQTVPVSEFE